MNKKAVSKNFEILTAYYDATLEHLKDPWRTRWVETSYGKTHLLSAGAEDAAPVLVLHGSASNGAGCWPLINGLSTKYHVYAPDAPRQLGKTEPFNLSTKNDDYGRWLEEILDQLGVGQIKVVGFSFGGWIACKLATYIPERIDKLVLLSPIGLVPFRVQYWMRAPALFLNLLVFQTDAAIGRFAALVAGPTASKDVLEELIAATRVYLKNFYMQAIPYRIKKGDLEKITAPMLVVVGRHDTFCDPEDVVSQIHECLPTARTEIIEDVGHVVYFEKPELVIDRVLAFFVGNV